MPLCGLVGILEASHSCFIHGQTLFRISWPMKNGRGRDDVSQIDDGRWRRITSTAGYFPVARSKESRNRSPSSGSEHPLVTASHAPSRSCSCGPHDTIGPMSGRSNSQGQTHIHRQNHPSDRCSIDRDSPSPRGFRIHCPGNVPDAGTLTLE